MKMSCKAAIFDMDGTILDTIEDLKDALNHSLLQFGRRGDFTAQETYAFFGSGARTAVTRALRAEAGSPDAPVDDAAVDEILAYYKSYYAAHCAIRTAPFPGIPELIRDLRACGVKTAVVSNKPVDAVQILARDCFPDCFDHIAGETAGISRKPSPDMLLHALASLGVSAADAIYIGDSEVDILTAKNADVKCICVDWGFRTREELLRAGADSIVSSCEELLACLQR